MELTRKEEYRNKKISVAVTAFAFVVMILFLIFKNIITSEPSFTKPTTNEITFDLSNGDNNNFNEASKSLAMASAQNKQNEDQKIVTDQNSDIPVESNAKSLANKYKRITISNTEHNTTTQNLLPLSTEQTGTETIKSDGGSEFGFNLKGRTIVTPPKFPKDTKEEGKVVVEIVVDKDGNVIEAVPNGRGTTTSSTELKAKAKLVASAIKFNSIVATEEQRGTITVTFSFN